MYVPTVKLKGLPKHIKVAGMHALLYLSKVLCTKIDILLKAFNPWPESFSLRFFSEVRRIHDWKSF